MKMHQQSIKILPKVMRHPSKSIQKRPTERGPGKTTKIMKKMTSGIASQIIDLEPKMIQNANKQSSNTLTCV
jgi:hypothetical protein